MIYLKRGVLSLGTEFYSYLSAKKTLDTWVYKQCTSFKQDVFTFLFQKCKQKYMSFVLDFTKGPNKRKAKCWAKMV